MEIRRKGFLVEEIVRKRFWGSNMFYMFKVIKEVRMVEGSK